MKDKRLKWKSVIYAEETRDSYYSFWCPQALLLQVISVVEQ